MTNATGQPLAAPGRRPDSLFTREYLGLLAGDAHTVLTAPLHWDRQDLMLAGGLGAVVAGSSVFDGQIRAESQENRTHQLDAFTKQVQRFGAEYSFLLLGGFATYGRFAGNAEARAVAMDGMTASIIASGVIAPVLKIVVGRVRPNAASRTFDFKPFGPGRSFPSGHTTQAFALAAVITAHYDQWWVQGLSYGVAGMVGYSRIEQNSHFASDVAAGAILGTVVGKYIVKRHNQPKSGAGQVSVAPFISGQATGLLLSRQY